MDNKSFRDNKRVKDEEELDESSESKRLRLGILDILEDFDSIESHDTVEAELASVMKSLEDEMSLPSTVHDTDASKPEISYLLGASDDELGLPPASNVVSDNITCSTDLIDYTDEKMDGYDEFWTFDSVITSYETGLGFKTSEEEDEIQENIVFDDLFEHSESVRSDFAWFLESLPAV